MHPSPEIDPPASDEHVAHCFRHEAWLNHLALAAEVLDHLSTPTALGKDIYAILVQAWPLQQLLSAFSKRHCVLLVTGQQSTGGMQSAHNQQYPVVREWDQL